MGVFFLLFSIFGFCLGCYIKIRDAVDAKRREELRERIHSETIKQKEKEEAILSELKEKYPDEVSEYPLENFVIPKEYYQMYDDVIYGDVIYDESYDRVW